MAAFKFLLTLGCTLAALAMPTFAALPSFGKQGVPTIRGKFADNAFKIIFPRAAQVPGPNFHAALATVDTFPALGGIDIQSSAARVFLRPGASFPTHTHPRAAETLYLVKGVLKTQFRFEGIAKPRIVTNLLQANQITVFPQGLAHLTTCISRNPCIFVSTLNSADPGVTLSPPIV